MSKNLKTHMWVCELNLTGDGWVGLADLAFDTRSEAREAARGMVIVSAVSKAQRRIPTRVVKYVRGA